MRTAKQLSPAELEALLSRYAVSRSVEDRNRVVEAQLYIAEIIARKFSGRGVDFDDLYQVAALALVKSVDRFDLARGIQFSSFATPAMVGEVKNYFRDKSRVLRPPRRSAELKRLVDDARERLEQALERSPRADEIAKFADLSEDEVLEALELSAMQPISLDARLSQADGAESEQSLAAVLGFEERGYAEFETGDMLSRAMAALTPRQREVIQMRYFENLPQREVARRVGLSQMSVSRSERGALEEMRRALKDNEA